MTTETPQATPAPENPGATPAVTVVTPAVETAKADPAAPAPTGEKPTEAPKGVFGEKWREEMAGEDEKAMKTLQRFTGPKDLWNAYQALRQKQSTGELKSPLPKDATPEQVTEWRKENGVPETADGYYKALPEGVIFGEEDKPGVTMFLEKMHGKNAPPELVSEALQTYVAAQKEAAIAISERDISVKETTEEMLRSEWGPDYKPNLNAMKEFLTANFPEAVQPLLLNGRLGDGTPIMSHPDVIKSFALLGRTLNPSGTATPGGGVDKIDVIEERIKAYENRMGTKEWYKDEKAQSDYRHLVTIRDNMTKKAG